MPFFVIQFAAHSIRALLYKEVRRKVSFFSCKPYLVPLSNMFWTVQRLQDTFRPFLIYCTDVLPLNAILSNHRWSAGVVVVRLCLHLMCLYFSGVFRKFRITHLDRLTALATKVFVCFSSLMRIISLSFYCSVNIRLFRISKRLVPLRKLLNSKISPLCTA